MDQQKELIPELCCLVARSYPTLCEPMDCRPPGSSVHEVSQARVLEWVAVAFSRGSSWSRDQTQVSYLAGRFFTTESPGTPIIQESFPEGKNWTRDQKETLYIRGKTKSILRDSIYLKYEEIIIQKAYTRKGTIFTKGKKVKLALGSYKAIIQARRQWNMTAKDSRTTWEYHSQLNHWTIRRCSQTWKFTEYSTLGAVLPGGQQRGKRGREERHSVKSSKPRDEWESCVKNNANKLIYKTEIESQV